mmetsp:Transcript_9867/g.20672  ORF Transcript_9867/g.20672 Transcript_9867/m.20672 type:complete len:95 (-) Transcript_9867:168-452(-)
MATTTFWCKGFQKQEQGNLNCCCGTRQSLLFLFCNNREDSVSATSVRSSRKRMRIECGSSLKFYPEKDLKAPGKRKEKRRTSFLLLVFPFYSTL